jgi:hypothetical protein
MAIRPSRYVFICERSAQLTVQEAKKLQDTIERVLAPGTLEESEKSHPRSLLLPPGKLSVSYMHQADR